MDKDNRREKRHPFDCQLTMTLTESATNRQVTFCANGIDFSDSGVRVECERPLEVNATVFIRADEYGLMGSGVVKHCKKRGSIYVAGLGLDAASRDRVFSRVGPHFEDYYEALQVSPNADAATIHRVFRIMAARYHPDNQETGDVEKFVRLKRIYEVLADTARRATYDVEYQMHRPERMPIFELREFVEGLDGESNRRMGVLCLLYKRRRWNPEDQGYSVLELESLMAFPREHLLFTMGYLKEKQYVRVLDNSDYEITSAGMDYVEAGVKSNHVLLRLLEASPSATAKTEREASVTPDRRSKSNLDGRPLN